MEEDNFKEIFNSFNPDLSSDADFMSTLQRSMNAVEIVRKRNVELHCRGKRAIVIASLAGFVAGVIMTILQPYIITWLGKIHLSLSIPSSQAVNIDYTLISWMATAIISLTIALNTYHMAMSHHRLPGNTGFTA